MVMVECLSCVSIESEEGSGKPIVASTGTWPFMVHMEEPASRDMKKKTT